MRIYQAQFSFTKFISHILHLWNSPKNVWHEPTSRDSKSTRNYPDASNHDIQLRIECIHNNILIYIKRIAMHQCIQSNIWIYMKCIYTNITIDKKWNASIPISTLNATYIWNAHTNIHIAFNASNPMLHIYEMRIPIFT